MASVEISIGGRRYELGCRDGEEDHLRTLARMIHAKVTDVGRTLGTLTETRMLLYAALMLADELASAPQRPQDAPSAPAKEDGLDIGMALALERLATRVETLADTLERTPISP